MLLARAGSEPLTSWPITVSAISLAWTDNARREAGWEIHRSTTGAGGVFSLLASVGPDVAWFTDQGLSPGTEYCYRVRSFRMTGPKMAFDSFTSASCSTTFTPPPAPMNVSAVPQGTSVSVTWTDNATTETSFRVERASAADGPWQSAANRPPNAASFLDEGRVVEELVCYRVVTVDPYGESVPSVVDCTRPVAAPTSVVATGIDPDAASLSWSDNSAFEDGYEVSRSRQFGAYVVIATLPPGANGYSDTSLDPEVWYQYQVRALADGGYSNTSTSQTAIFVVSGPPSPPQLDAYPAGSTAAWISIWSQEPSIESYRVERSFDGVSWAAFPETSYDFGLTAEQRVCYRAYASNRRGESAASEPDCTTPPAAPTDVRMVGGELGFDFTWTDNSSVEDGYGIFALFYYEDGYTEAWLLAVADANATSFTLPYDWYPGWGTLEVAALKDGGQSDFGTWATDAATTAAVRRAPVVMDRLKVHREKPPSRPPRRAGTR